MLQLSILPMSFLVNFKAFRGVFLQLLLEVGNVAYFDDGTDDVDCDNEAASDPS